MRRTTATLIVTLLLPFAGRAAHARPPHQKALADYLGPFLASRLNDCRTCHVPAQDGDGDEDLEVKPHNPFGDRLKRVKAELVRAGKPSGIPARLEAVAVEDSDGDGVPNLVELLAGHSPGEADDTPTPAEVTQGRRALVEFRNTTGAFVWAPFEPVRRPSLPRVPATARVRNPIDAFLAAEHEARGLKPRPEAPRPVLLRRVCLDLTGLPPSAEELHAFLEDEAPDAFEKVVDRLLASPRHGERWGRHWMDVWRYSDWAGWGQQVRDSQPHVWRWRDWIVASLNQDKGYDRMVVEMLAADEAAPDDPEALRATGYLVRNYKRLSREKWMQDVVDHTAQAFLGLTFGCARCHDHLFDPILQDDYYRMRAVFEPHHVRTDRIPGRIDATKEGLVRAFDADPAAKTFLFVRGDDRNPAGEPLAPGVPESLGGALRIEPVPLPRAAWDPDRRDFVLADDRAESEGQVAGARRAFGSARREALIALLPLLVRGPIPAGAEMAGAIKRIDALVLAAADRSLAEARLSAMIAALDAEALEEAGRKDSEDWVRSATVAAKAQRAAAVHDARRQVLVARRERRPAPADRKVAAAAKALAKAQAAAREPATTAYTKRPHSTYPATSTGRRLAFARWMTHRENPLAARVAVNHIWLRHFGQAIVPSVADFGRNGRPPSHPALLDWLAAEFMDRGWSMKALHRLLVTSAAYRRSSTPDATDLALDPDNVYLWRMTPRRLEAEAVRDGLFFVAGALVLTMNGPEIDHREGLTNPRRSLYFRHAAEKQMELLQIFDGPGVTECYRRGESILPQQALALANSELPLRLARRLTGSLVAGVGSDPSAFTTAAFEQVLARPPTPAELAECTAFLELRAQALRGADPPLRARESLVHVLMNHHDFVTIR